jgi:quinol monooxygenase YgiN
MIVVIGTVRMPAENLERARPIMRAVLEASRAEDGCLEYAYSEDVLTPGLVRIAEVWRDRGALSAHSTAAHMAPWRAAWPELGIGERRLALYEAGEPEPL